MAVSSDGLSGYKKVFRVLKPRCTDAGVPLHPVGVTSFFFLSKEKSYKNRRAEFMLTTGFYGHLEVHIHVTVCF